MQALLVSLLQGLPLQNLIKKMINEKELKKIWDRLEPGYYENGSWGQKLWHNLKLQAIKSVLPDKVLTFLDVGCADGYFLNRIAGFLPKTQVYGIDISPKLIKAAKKKYPKINFKVADAHKLPFKEKTFDLIICTETLDHTYKPEQVLLEIKRVLKKTGKIILELDSGSLLFRLVFIVWINFLRGKVWQNAHLHQLNVKRLEMLFKKTGLTIERKKIFRLGMAVIFILKT